MDNILIILLIFFCVSGLNFVWSKKYFLNIAITQMILFCCLFLCDAIYYIIVPSPALILHFSGWLGTVVFQLTPLGAFFMLLVAVGGVLSALYSYSFLRGSLSESATKWHFFFWNLLIGSMIALTLCRDILSFILFWEMMSIASFFLLFTDNVSKESERVAKEWRKSILSRCI